jgi:hypothetical protein
MEHELSKALVNRSPPGVVQHSSRCILINHLYPKIGRLATCHVDGKAIKPNGTKGALTVPVTQTRLYHRSLVRLLIARPPSSSKGSLQRAVQMSCKLSRKLVISAAEATNDPSHFGNSDQVCDLVDCLNIRIVRIIVRASSVCRP